ILDDGVSIDGVADRLSYLEMLQHRVAQVQADIRVIGAGRSLHSQLPLLSQLPHDVRRDVVDDEIDGAFAELEAAHRIVGHDLQHDPVVPGWAAEVLIETCEYDSVGRLQRTQLVSPPPDGR